MNNTMTKKTAASALNSETDLAPDIIAPSPPILSSSALVNPCDDIIPTSVPLRAEVGIKLWPSNDEITPKTHGWSHSKIDLSQNK